MAEHCQRENSNEEIVNYHHAFEHFVASAIELASGRAVLGRPLEVDYV